jgi:hypothetical protein
VGKDRTSSCESIGMLRVLFHSIVPEIRRPYLFKEKFPMEIHRKREKNAN